jgi:hypothetical protein
MSPYWEIVRWATCIASIGASLRYLPKALVLLVAAFTHDETRSRQCLEVLRLTRRDASSIPSYLPEGGTPSEVSIPATAPRNIRGRGWRSPLPRPPTTSSIRPSDDADELTPQDVRT